MEKGSGDGTLGSGGAAFSTLLRQLDEQHQREVAELQKTIQELKQTKASRGALPTAQPKGDSDCVAVESVRQESKDQNARADTPSTEEPTQDRGMKAEGTVIGEDKAGHQIVIEEVGGTTVLPTVPSSPGGASTPSKKKLRLRGSFVKAKSEGENVPKHISMILDSAIGVIILLNIVFIFVRLEYTGYMTAVEIGLQDPGKWPDLTLFFDVMQHIFCAIFLIELGFRCKVYKLKYFYEHGHGLQKFNIFDATIVLFTCLDLYIISPLINGGNGSDLTVIRVVRFVRLLRALRVVRTFEIFSKLRVLFSTVAASFYALLWSMVLLFITMLMAALILTQIVNPFLTDSGIGPTTISWMYKHYGTAGRSLWTVFEMTFSGGWPAYARTLVEDVHPAFAWFFALYISTVVFAMTRIITALFLKDTLAVAANDAEMMIQEKTREKKAYASKLLDFFNAADTSGDGIITLDEFETFLLDPRVRTYLTTLELDTHETQNLFFMLDDGDGAVTAEEFVKGAIRLKGVARSQDVVSIMHDFTRLHKSIDTLKKQLSGCDNK